MKASTQKTSKKIAYQLEKLVTDVVNNHSARQYLNYKKVSENSWIIGNYIVVQKPHKLYDILSVKDKKTIYQDIYCIDGAIALVENLNQNRKDTVVAIEKAEKQYANSYNDVMRYKLLIGANNENIEVYRHKYAVSKAKMDAALRNIKRYRILNFDK